MSGVRSNAAITRMGRTLDFAFPVEARRAVPSTGSVFAVQLKQFADKTQKQLDQVVGLITVKMAQRLDERSPVGDATYWKHPAPKGYVGGRFRGNWQLGVDIVPSGETGRIDPGGSATVEAIVGSVPAKAAGHVFYLTNNVPYAQAIEDGHSQRQAPNGVVALTAMEFQSVVEGSVGEVVWQ